MRFDLNEVAALLHIHKEAQGHPKLKAISDSAMKQLESMAKEQEDRERGEQPEPEVPVDGSVHVDDEEPVEEETDPVERRI